MAGVGIQTKKAHLVVEMITCDDLSNLRWQIVAGKKTLAIQYYFIKKNTCTCRIVLVVRMGGVSARPRGVVPGEKRG